MPANDEFLLLDLPYPPTTNTYYRHVRIKGQNRTLISKKGREFQQAVAAVCFAERVKPLFGSLKLSVDVHPPDRRARDLDNILKSLQDALQKGGCYADDSQIDVLHIIRGPCVKGGRVRVILRQL